MLRISVLTGFKEEAGCLPDIVGAARNHLKVLGTGAYATVLALFIGMFSDVYRLHEPIFAPRRLQST